MDPKPLVVFHTSLRRWPADHGPQLWTRALVQDEAHIDGAAGCGCATCWPAHPPRSLALRVRDVEPRGGDALRGRALHPPPGAGRRARHARRSRVTPAPPDAPPPGEVCGDGVASVDDRYECAAGGGLSLGRPGAAPARRRIRAWRAPRPGARRVERRGRHVWRCHAAPRSPAGRGTGRAGVRGAVVARVVFVSVVVVARPVVRHTRPTPRAADCRPAASGTPVSRSSACACSPCGDPQTSGWSLPLR